MNRTLKNVLFTSIYFLVILILVFLLVKYVGQRVDVIGISMVPTLEDGDNLLVDKLTYSFRTPERFEIVVFPYKYEPNTNYIKRVIGLPGETIRIDEEGNILIDGQVLDENYGREVITDPGRAYVDVELGEDEYFVMGDNRNNSQDSRDPNVGNIKLGEISGRALFRLFPINRMGIIKHK